VQTARRDADRNWDLTPIAPPIAPSMTPTDARPQRTKLTTDSL
jgi:hypothetical protein